jgi:hypothetical protein
MERVSRPLHSASSHKWEANPPLFKCYGRVVKFEADSEIRCREFKIGCIGAGFIMADVQRAGDNHGRCLVGAAPRGLRLRYLYQVESGRSGRRCAGHDRMAGLPNGITFNASLLFQKDNRWSLGPTILGYQMVPACLCRCHGAIAVLFKDGRDANVIRVGQS